MGNSGRRPERLADLAQAVGVTQDYPGVHITRPPTPVITPQDIGKVREALTQTRADNFESKKSFLHRKPGTSSFSSEEATPTLSRLVRNRCTPGQAQHLISLGADVNLARHKSGSAIKKVRKKDQDDVRSTLFKSAVELGDPAIVNVLADHADQDNLNEGLGVAISNRNLEVLKILMIAGANPNLYEQAFREAIRNGDEQLVCVLVSGKVVLSEEMACRSLYEAVQSGCIRTVRVLIWSQADADIESPSALSVAVHAESLPQVAALCLADHPPSPQHLARTIASTCTNMALVNPARLKMIEMLLAAGASGEEIGQTLSNATKYRHQELVQLLAEYSDFDVKHTPTAIKNAMSSGDLTLFDSLIGMVQEQKVIDDLLLFLPLTRGSIPLQTKSAMTRTTVACHPSIQALSEALKDAANYQELEMAQYLVGAGASVDHQSGSALATAVRLRSMALFSILLAGQPSQPVLLHTLELVTELPLALKFKMTRALLDAGAEGKEVNRALCSAVERHDKSHESYELIQLLVRNKADVNTDNAVCFVKAIRGSDIRAVEVLLQGRPHDMGLDIAFSTTASIDDLKTRYKAMKLLLIAGARGQAVNKLLSITCEAHDRSENSYRLISLLVRGGADVNTADATCLLLLVALGDIRGVEILLRGKLNASSLEKAFSSATVVKEPDIRYDLMSQLLVSGAQGQSVDQALINVIDGSPHNERFSRLLVHSGKPNINVQNGKAICHAVEHHDVELTRLLVEHQPTPESLNNALKQAVKLNDRDIRFELCKILLKAGSNGSALSEALITATQTSHRDVQLSKTLLHHGASVDYDSGRAIRTAITRYDYELLRLLLASPVRPETLLCELEYVLKLNVEEHKITLSKALLSTNTTMSAKDLGALLHLTFAKSDDLRLLRLFLDKGASVNCDPLEAFQKAVQHGNPLALEALLGAKPTQSSVQQTFENAWKASGGTNLNLLRILLNDKTRWPVINMNQYLLLAVQDKPCSLPLIGLLLHAGASVSHSQNECMHKTAASFDNKALELLLEQPITRNEVSSVLQRALQNLETWNDPQGIITVQLLLKNGAFGEVVDRGLLNAVERKNSYNNAREILTLLVEYQASCDYQNGQAFEIAAREGDVLLAQRLFDCNPSRSTINNAFSYILTSRVDEEQILDLIDLFVSRSAGKLDLNVKHKQLPPILILCVERWPDSTVVLKHLLQAGASANLIMDTVVEKAPAEPVTTLLWALCKPGVVLGDNIIDLLIPSTDVNFSSPRSKTTALIAAVRSSRASVVERLIRRSANVSAADHTGRTPLCYAASRDEIGIMQLLKQAGAPSNDGSLHEAVYHCKTKAATMLLENDHDPNFPSLLYSSQPPLALLVMHPEIRPQWELETLFGLLFSYGANGRYQNNGKSLLLTALDMPNASHVTPPLLSAFMSAIVNEECNMYHHNKLRYSPMSYLVHNKQLSPFSQKQALLQILSTYSCKEIFYHEEGPQPEGFTATTAPAELVVKEKQRRERLKQIAEAEELHQLELRRRQEAAAAKEEEETRRHEATLRRAREQSAEQQRLSQQSHQLRLTQMSEASTLQERTVRESAQQQLQIDYDRNTQLENFATLRRANEASHVRALADQQLQSSKNQSLLQIETKKQLAIQEQKVVDTRVEGERKMHEMARISRREQEEMENRNIRKNMLAIEAKRGLVAENNKLLVRQREILKLQVAVQGRQQAQIGYVEDVD